MKKLILFFLFVFFSGGYLYAQKLAVPKEIALINLKIDLKEIKDLTNQQWDQLADIEVQIDKEYPFLNTISYSTRKEKIKLLESIFALREKLYPKVLTPEQMEQFKVLLQKNRENLQKTNTKKRKS